MENVISEERMNYNVCFVVDFDNFNNLKAIKGADLLYRENDVAVAVLGNLYSRDHKRLTPADVCTLYAEYSNEVETRFEGIYSVIIFDFSAKKTYVFQDFSGSNQSFYYYNTGSKVLLSTSLKTILMSENEDWQMNPASVKQFILRGYSADNQTLIKNVCKIPGKRYLMIDAGKRSVKLKKYKKEKNPKKEISIEEYDEVMSRQTKAVIHEGMATTVSSGYDSNYILHNLNKLLDKNIDGFCIGGTIGTDEIPDAEKICSYYGNVDLHTRRVNGDSFNKLPEIVYILEGSMYERGIFLQYELADLIKSYGVEHVMLGECADQVLNFEMYHPVHQAMSILRLNRQKFFTRYFKKLHYRPYRTVYDMASYIVIKKNGIMMNHFGLNPEYPYMRKDFMRTAENAVKIGERKKEFHKKAITALLPKEITNIIRKMPGSTELKDLFIGDITFDDIKAMCEKSEYYTPKKFDDIYYEIDNYIKITYLEVFRKMFIENREKYLTETFGDYDLKELLFPEKE